MTEQQVRDFLAQFDQAREDFKTWPQWMQDAAVERAASFPMPPKDGVKGMPPMDDPARPTMSMFATAADYNAAMDEWLRSHGVGEVGRG
jgi:hypothetical protein